jgi:hypothetical protein
MSTPPPVAPGAGSKQQTSGMAIASLVLGICSIVLCLGPLAGIPAVIMGHKANSDIRKSGGLLGGSGMATAGLVTGYLSVLMIFVVGLLAAVAIPNFVKAKQQAQFQACKKNMAVIQTTKEMWAKDNAKPDDAVPVDADLFGPGKSLLLKPECPAGGTFSLNSVKENPSCTVHGSITQRE